MRVPKWLDDLLFKPASPIGIIAARTILVLQALWIILSRPALASLSSWPDPFWAVERWNLVRFGIFRFSGSPVVEQTAWILLHVALVAALFGIAPRVSCLLSALLLYHFAPFEGLLPGFVDLAGLTGLTLPMLGLVILAFAEIPHRNAPWSPEYRWPLVLLQLILAFHYVNAGLGKMHWAGFAWYTPENVRILAGVLWGFNKPSLALMVLDRPWIAGAIGVCTFLLEFLFPLAIISRRARWVILPAAAAAMVLRLHIFGFFTLSFPLLLLLINWDWIDLRLRKAAAGETAPEVELNVLAAQRESSPAARERAEAILRGPVNWRRAIEFAQMHGTTQLLAGMLGNLNHRLDAEYARVLDSLVQRNSARAVVQYRETRRVLSAFAAKGIRAIAYKGTVLSIQLFGRANARISGDIDVLVDQREFKAAAAVMADLGHERSEYGVADEVLLETSKEATFINQQTHCSVELQWRALPKNASCGFETATPHLHTMPFANDPTITTLADDDLFLALAHHGLGHRWDSVKWIVDIDAFCRRNDVAWDTVAARARETGSWNIVLLAVHVAADLLHTPVPERFSSAPPRVLRTAARMANSIRTETEIGDLESFWIQLLLRESWRDRMRFVRFVSTPKPRDISKGKFLGLPNFLQPLLRPLRLLFESHAGHKRVVSEVQKIAEWDA